MLLFTTPQTDFGIIKQELLSILTLTHSSGDLNGYKIPSDPEDVLLGIPVDPDDLQQGWTKLFIPEQELDNAQSGRKRRAGGKRSALNCPQGVGLKDGAALAFKFRTPGYHEEDDMMDISEEWDVIIPSYEDDRGSETAGSQHSAE